MNHTTTIQTAMQQNGRSALKALAFALSLIVYFAGLIYAGVRSFTLFSATIAPELLPLAVLGIIALEVSALALPLTIHYWAAPGAQRMAAYAFYLADLALIVGNAILDAAHHAGTVLPAFLQVYGVYAVPGLPVLCMAGWALLWALDPASKEADLVATVRAATHESLLAQIAKATEAVDITEAVELAAGEAARALVGETLGRAPRRKQPAALPDYRLNAAVPALSPVNEAIADIERRAAADEIPTGGFPAARPPKTAKRNGHRAGEGAAPKA